MKLREITLAFGTLLATTLFSCSDDREAPIIEGDKVQANFTAGIAAATRASDVLWDVNDAIGIVMLNHDSKDIEDEAFNLRYFTTTAGGNFTPGGASSIIYFPQNGDEVTFKSYYPYKESLQRNMLIPVSVANQTTLPVIDFMSAEHLSGFSKNDPNVHLEFHHRLSKVIFNLSISEEVTGILPEDVSLTIKGMKTTGTYDLLNEKLIVDDASGADLALPIRGKKTERTGIVLPRAAGSGVTFELGSANGSNFTAEMPADLELKSGYKYIFNLALEGSSMSLSVTIKDWIEGPTTNYDMLGITTPAQDSYGVTVGDQMQVYIQNGNVFDNLRVFTYGSDGKWTTPNPVYWDEIQQDPVNLRATMVVTDEAKAKAASLNQIPDILIAQPLSVERNHAADLIFNHAGSRVVVVLQSNIYSADEMNAATITLPNYFIGGKEEKGVFVPGTTRGNVTVDRTNASDNYAIIQPQPVSPDAGLVTVNIGGKTFTARTTSDGFLYEAGVAYKLIITVNENNVAVSATVVDWEPADPQVFEVAEVTIPAGSTTGVAIGSRMTVYKKDGTAYSPWTTFTYTGNDVWSPDAPIHWNTVTDPSVDLRASLVAAQRLNSTQMDDLLIADDLNVATGVGANFTLRHAASKVVAILVSDVFTETQLNNATITMPQYLSGGSVVDGKFSNGQMVTDIILAKSDQGSTRNTSTNTQIAIFQPQTIAAGKNIFKVTVGGRDYWAKAPDGGLTYEAGYNYGVTIHINDNTLTVSAKVIDWTEQSFDLNAFTVGTTLPNASSGVDNGDQMVVYTGNETDRTALATFTYNKAADSWTTTPKVYWENIPSTASFYASIFKAAKLDDTQLDDYLIATPVAYDEGKPINFTLSHPAAKVMVQLRSTDNSYSAEELANMQLTLPDYVMGAAYNNGKFELTSSTTGDIKVVIVDNTATAIIRPQIAVKNRPLVNIYNPIGDRNYVITSDNDINLAAGMITKLVIDMKKTALTMSANATPWVEGSTFDFVAPAITISGSLGHTSDFFKGKTIYGYILGSNYKSATFTYTETSAGNNSYTWVGSETFYWDDIKGQTLDVAGVYYPNGNAPTLNANTTTFAWNLPNDQTSGYDNYDLLMSTFSVSTPSYVNFDFNHVLSKVRVKLVSDEFTSSELLGANVKLSNVMIKGSASLATATATGANTRESVTMYTDDNGKQYSALVMPQTVTTGTAVVSIQLRDYPGETFPAILTSDMVFTAGKETVITVTLKKTKVEISATLQDWTPGSTGGIIIQ